MITKFDTYNESLRDKMIGKSSKEINYNLGRMNPSESLNKSISLNYLDGVKRSIQRIKKLIKSDNKPKKLKKKLESKYYLQNALDSSVIYSSKKGHLDIIKYLIEQGANITDESISEASEYGHLDVVKYLVENGADIHYEDELSLRSASNFGHLDVVKYLVEQGADIHIQNEEPLYVSMIQNRLSIVKYLISVGSNIYTKGDLILKYACTYTTPEMVQYLLDIGNKFTTDTIYDIYLYTKRNYRNEKIISVLKNKLDELNDN